MPHLPPLDERFTYSLAKPTWTSRHIEVGELSGSIVALVRAPLKPDCSLPPTSIAGRVESVLFGRSVPIGDAEEALISHFPRATEIDLQSPKISLKRVRSILGIRPFSSIAAQTRRWKDVLRAASDYGASVKSLVIALPQGETFDPATLANFRSLRGLSVRGVGFQWRSRPLPASLLELELMGLEEDLDLDGIVAGLERLSIIGAWGERRPSTVRNLRSLEDLRSLDLVNTRSVESEPTALPSTLKELGLYSAEVPSLRVSNEVRLTSLSLSECDPSALLRNSCLSDLIHLSLQGGADHGLGGHATEISGLNSLHLSGDADGQFATAFISRNPGLDRLSLSNFDVDRPLVEALAGAGVTSLSIPECRLADQSGISQVFGKLRELDAENSTISDEDLGNPESLRLESIDVGHTAVNVPTVVELARLASMRNLAAEGLDLRLPGEMPGTLESQVETLSLTSSTLDGVSMLDALEFPALRACVLDNTGVGENKLAQLWIRYPDCLFV